MSWDYVCSSLVYLLVCSENADDKTYYHNKSFVSSLPIQTRSVDFSFVNHIVSNDHWLYMNNLMYTHR